MAQWVAVCRLDELGRGGPFAGCAGAAAGGFPAGAEVVALSGRCPHSGGSLGHGWIEEGEVVCPLHLAVPAG